MTNGDGDGWITCSLGHRHWGRYGAAGLLIRTADRVLLQHRAAWSHHGDTWGMPGGARDSHESAATTALREAAEEAGIEPADVLLTDVHVDDHGDWSYATVLAEPIRPLEPVPANAESVAIGWIPAAEVQSLPLHPGFAASWPALRASAPAPVVVVDAANVVGSRPDGWWRDRPAATARLSAAVLNWAAAGVGPGVLPGDDSRHALRFPQVVFVVEGAAAGYQAAADPRMTVVRATGSGDDALVDVVRRTPTALVVTADRELRERVGALGAHVAGPGWLRSAVGL